VPLPCACCVCRLYHSIKAREIRISGQYGEGEINEALWMLLSKQSSQSQRPRYYVRLDGGLRAAPSTALSAALSAASSEAKSSAQSRAHALRRVNLDEDLFLEMWQSALAALTVVWDMCELKEHNSHANAKRRADNSAAAAAAAVAADGDSKGGAAAAGAVANPNANANPNASSVVTANGSAAQPNGAVAGKSGAGKAVGAPPPVRRADSERDRLSDGTGGVLSLVTEGVFAAMGIACHYERARRRVSDQIVMALARMTGLLQTFRDDEIAAAHGTRAAEANRRDSALIFFAFRPKVMRASKLVRTTPLCTAGQCCAMVCCCADASALVCCAFDVLSSLPWSVVLAVV
jgi:hypothetical protein